jgi:hypothetical protein
MVIEFKNVKGAKKVLLKEIIKCMLQIVINLLYSAKNAKLK